jgi:ketosteroid isomerase-like protein
MSLPGGRLVELLEENKDALNRGDYDTAIRLAAPDIVYVRPGGLPELHGADAVREWMEPDAFESQRYELLDHEVSGNRALTRSRTIARGAGSGIEMEIEALVVWTFTDDGKVARVEVFTLDEEEAARRALEPE